MARDKIKNLIILSGSGSTPSRKNDSYWNSRDIPWLKTDQIGEYKIFDTNEYISQKAFDECSMKIYPAGSVSIAMYGEGKTRGSVSMLAAPMATNQACFTFVIDDKKINSKYVYYYLKNQYDNLRQLSSGVRKNLNADIIKNVEINYPQSRSQQDAIACVLGSIDDKIALNKKAIISLESIAKTLYDYWFVQFDFPDANGTPYKTSGGKMEWNETLSREIPAGWKVRRIKDVLSVVTGKEDANFATMNGKFKFFTCSDDVLKCDIAAFDGNAVLLAGNGNFNVKHYTGKFNAYQRTYVLIPNDNNLYGVLYLSVLRMVDTLTKHSTGSIVKFITKGDVEDIKILEQPNKELYSKINVLMDKIEKLQEENERLTGIRDFLLPMLMNGQVTFCQ